MATSTLLVNSKFNLEIVGVAGLFGGETAVSAMATAHLYQGRRWLGWFNSPGSYIVAKHFGRIANSRFWNGFFPGPRDSPAVSFGLDGKKGPKHIAALSGTTIMETGHLAYLTTKRSKEVRAEEIRGRVTTPVDVAYLTMKPVNYDCRVEGLPYTRALLGLIPILVSVTTCVACVLASDWFSFSLILTGVFSNGCACIAIDGGRLAIERVKKPAPGAPSGHGILMGEDGIVVIKGEERDVRVITKGRFVLQRDSKQDDEGNMGKTQGNKEPRYHAIGVCSFILVLQFLLQLLLVPRGTAFGQIMFVTSLGVSWGYNSYLSSMEKEKIQASLLFKALGNPEMRRFRIGTRTAAAVFVCLLLFHGVERSTPEEDCYLRSRILDSCGARDTVVWRRWKDKVIMQLLNIDNDSHSLPCLSMEEDEWEDGALSESDRQLLEEAAAAFRGYFSIREGLPDDSDYKVFEKPENRRRDSPDGFIYFKIEEQ